MKLNTWTARFRQLYNRAVENYRRGVCKPDAMFTAAQKRAIAAAGLKPINFYDYAEDFVRAGEPDFETALLLASARREYFLLHQQGKPSRRAVASADLPAKSASLAGIEWLPRIIRKADGFLKGEICNEIMYCCSGDRNFFKVHGLNPVDFLRVVAEAGGNPAVVTRWVKAQKRRQPPGA